MKPRITLIFTLILTLSAAAQSLEIPAPRPGEQVIYHTNYTLSYNEEFEQADWVAYELTRQELTGTEMRKDNFRSDSSVLTSSAALADYKGSGYDRGHLAPAADMKFSETAMSKSFYLSNMSPQAPSFNRGVWKNLESLVRRWAWESLSVFVVTGPILNKADYLRIGEDRVAVPEYYYKIILDAKEPVIRCLAFLLPNKKCDVPPESYTVTVDDIEALTEIDFFPALADELEEKLESRIDKSLWDFNPPPLPETGTVSVSTEQKPVSQTNSTLYWMNSSNNTRHNPNCRYYGNTKNGYYTENEEGTPYGACGG